MSSEVTVLQQARSIMNSEDFQSKLLTTMDERKANKFKASILQLISNKTSWTGIPIQSILGSCLIAATLDLPINQNLGYAYVIPYKGKNPTAQFQIGYKGIIQLAHRTGQYVNINANEVREGELDTFDYLTGEVKFTWIQDPKERLKAPIIGYVSYFELINGFKMTLYMSKEEVQAHAMKYSQAYKKGYDSLWKSDFDTMARKTVIKGLLTKWGPLSTDMERAMIHDQGSTNLDTSTLSLGDVEYVDNNGVKEGKVEEMLAKKDDVMLFITQEAKNITALKKVYANIKTPEQKTAYILKYIDFSKNLSTLTQIQNDIDPEQEGMDLVIDKFDEKHAELME